MCTDSFGEYSTFTGTLNIGNLKEFECSVKQDPQAFGHCLQEQSFTMQLSLPVSATKSKSCGGLPMATFTDE